MSGDKLVIDLDLGRYALDTSAVAGVVEKERLPFLPGGRGFASGVISFRNEPVTVIDLPAALGDFGSAPPSSHKVIVLKDKGRILGVDVGSSVVSFLWKENIEGKVTAEKGLYTSGRIHAGTGPIDIVDWPALYDETLRMLSAEDHAAKESPHSR
ncbi:MAG: chemotaxis protein CheW [Thermodesulfobacteriota bacterium]|nr:MAG: chemotaxis protein CheW [Thermodesulfobacteriota bacterium]